MGLFDYIRCEYPLPNGGVPENILTKHPFQTKDTDEQYMETYTITADGKLMHDGQEEPFCGELNFYTSNIVGSGYGQFFTSDGEDAESFDYSAFFEGGDVGGTVTRIVENSRTKEPALPSSEMWSERRLPTDEERKQGEMRDNESLVGREVYVMWGGQEIGYAAKVAAENKRQLVVESSEHGFENLDRSDRDRLFFDTEEEALRERAAKKKAWDDKTRALAEQLEAKRAKQL